MKRMICGLCAVVMLLACGCAPEKKPAANVPVEKFFEALNENDYAQYKKCHLPEMVDAIGAFEFEEQYIERRKSMMGERVIYEILDTSTLSGDVEQDVKKYYCDELGTTYEQLCLVQLRSNLSKLPLACYCIQRDGKWYILSWYTLKD